MILAACCACLLAAFLEEGVAAGWLQQLRQKEWTLSSFGNAAPSSVCRQGKGIPPSWAAACRGGLAGACPWPCRMLSEGRVSKALTALAAARQATMPCRSRPISKMVTHVLLPGSLSPVPTPRSQVCALCQRPAPCAPCQGSWPRPALGSSTELSLCSPQGTGTSALFQPAQPMGGHRHTDHVGGADHTFSS